MHKDSINNICINMVKIKAGFYIRTQNNYSEIRKINNYNISISPFEFKDSYNTIPYVDYDNYSIDCLIIDTKLWALMLRDLPKSAIAMIMQIAYIIEPNTNLVRITQNISSAIYSKGDKPARQWYNVVNQLIEYGFMVRTNQLSTYVINHNILFKGDLNSFAKKYKEMYGDYKGTYTDGGRLIIDKKNNIKLNDTYDEIAEKIKKLNYRANKYKYNE